MKRPTGASHYGTFQTYAEALEVARARAARGPIWREQRMLEACTITHFYEQVYPRQGIESPYVDLCIALMHMALADMRGDAPSQKGGTPEQKREEAIEWIAGRSGCAPVVSFRVCCEVLGLDEVATRRALLGMVPVWGGGDGGEPRGRST